ncbi:MAG: hypothetical protein ACK5WY_08305 [Holosporaceae bacterium]|jgi:hypothetical protein
MKISKSTRNDIIDQVFREKISWWGRIDEIEFLSRLYDLNSIR